MTPEQVIKFYGGEVKAAAELGINPRTIINWVRSEETQKIPYWSQCAIAYISNGKLKADKCKIEKGKQ